jgi:hypothetical protein
VRLAQYVDALREGADPRKDGSSDPIARVLELDLVDHAPPGLLERLAKLDRIGLLNGDALMSIVAQAPIDPLNLFSAVRKASPGEWVFSAIDFGVVRVLARDSRRNVAAAVRIDLMDSSVTTLVMNHAGQLTTFRRYEPDGVKVLERVQELCDEAVQAASRESVRAPRS